MTGSVPELRLSDFTSGDAAARVSFREALFASLSRWGFVILADHNVPTDLLDRAYTLSAALFDRPEGESTPLRADCGGTPPSASSMPSTAGHRTSRSSGRSEGNPRLRPSRWSPCPQTSVWTSPLVSVRPLRPSMRVWTRPAGCCCRPWRPTGSRRALVRDARSFRPLHPPDPALSPRPAGCSAGRRALCGA